MNTNDFSGCKFKYGDHVIPYGYDESDPHVTVWMVESVMKDHAGPGQHYYCCTAPGYGSRYMYENIMNRTTRPVSDFFKSFKERRESNPTISDVTPDMVGKLIDKFTSNTRRDPREIALRVLIETVELAVDVGCDFKDIMGAVMDTVHNECTKFSKATGNVVYPSQVNVGFSLESIKEIADVNLCLKDLMYLIGAGESTIKKLEVDKFTALSNTPTDKIRTNGHTIFVIKD